MKKLNESVLRLGDIALVTGTKLHSAAIRRLTHSDVSHAMIYVEGCSVVDATPDGVHARNTHRLLFYDRMPVHVLRPVVRLDQSELHELVDYARAQVGTRYTKWEACKTYFGGARTSNRKQFCSRLVAEAYAHVGIRLVRNAHYCSPEDIMRSPMLRPVPLAYRHVPKSYAIPASEPSINHEMMRATNRFLTLARRSEPSIENMSDVDDHLMRHPEYDPQIAKALRESGYLEIMATARAMYPWVFDSAALESADIDDFSKRYHCLFTLRNRESSRRFQSLFAHYQETFAVTQLQTFKLLRDLYEALIADDETRRRVAKVWLAAHPLREMVEQSSPYAHKDDSLDG